MTTDDDVQIIAAEIRTHLHDLRVQLTACEADTDALSAALAKTTRDLQEAIDVLRRLIRGVLPIDHAVAWLNTHDDPRRNEERY